MAGLSIMLVCLLLCSAVFFGIGIYAIRKKTPMWFYSGSEEEIAKEKFHDIKEYNRKNGIMWIGMGIIIWIIPFLMSALQWKGGLFAAVYIGAIVGYFIFMCLYWNHLHKKYTNG